MESELIYNVWIKEWATDKQWNKMQINFGLGVKRLLRWCGTWSSSGGVTRCDESKFTNVFKLGNNMVDKRIKRD